MQSIIDIPFWAMYLLVRLQLVFTVLSILSAVVAVVLGAAWLVATIDGEEALAEGSKKFLDRKLIACFILSLTCAITFPGDREFGWYMAAKVANEALTSEIGSKSQDVIVNWLNQKLTEQMTDTKK